MRSDAGNILAMKDVRQVILIVERIICNLGHIIGLA